MSKQVARVGKYEIVQRIGTGGFGAVYEARDPFLKRPVAVKTCLVSDEAEQARFFREAELVGSLRHRNITTVYDFGIHDGMPYLVEELLSGDDLDRLIRREDPIPLPRKVEILIGIAYGLEYAHNAGILHRDIKPSNIRLLEDGTVKIMDFGIARSLQPEGDSDETGTALGTSAYLAPERIQGHVIDRRADIFSFGVLAYELLTCHKPFTGHTTSDVLDRILKEEPQPITLFLADAPAPLAAVVSRAMEKEPSRRYESVAALREDLLAIHRNLLGHTRSPVTATQPVPIALEVLTDSPTPPSFSMERVGRRTIHTAAVAALAFVAVSGSLILLWPGKQRETEPVAIAPVKTEAPASPAIPPADADSPPSVPDEGPPEVVPARRPRSNSEPEQPSMIRFSSPAPVEEKETGIALASTGSVFELQQARRYTRAAEEPGLSRETRAYLYLRSALAYHAARDLPQARRSLEKAFALSPELDVDAQTYGASFTRLARKARAERPGD